MDYNDAKLKKAIEVLQSFYSVIKETSDFTKKCSWTGYDYTTIIYFECISYKFRLNTKKSYWGNVNVSFKKFCKLNSR